MTVEISEPHRELSVEDATKLARELRENIERVFKGKPRVVRWSVASVIAGGHILLEDVPGVGKTTLGLAMARSLGLSFRRIQFTSDLLPGDILGVSVYSSTTGEFSFRKGPIFAGLVLADEINRTTPRTQSALLEAMSEGSVSVDDKTRELPRPFVVVATQNPLDHHGTYPLPESQLDRFMVRISIGHPRREVERAILLERHGDEPVRDLDGVLDAGGMLRLQELAATVTVGDSVVDYILSVVEATREHPKVRIGISTRGALDLVQMVRAVALMEGRDYAIPDDAREVFVPCFAHRLSLKSGRQEKASAEAMVESILAEVEIPT